MVKLGVNTIGDTLTAIKAMLSATDEPQLEAEILLAHALQKPRSYLFMQPNEVLTANIQEKITTYVTRRVNNEPIAYILGEKEFWSLPLLVSEDTLVPRPETELLVETALTLFDKKSCLKVADLGTGSGAIALALGKENPAWQIYATDICDKALTLAETNAKRLHINNITFLKGDWCQALLSMDFDLIISNPPYIAETEWEAYKPGLLFEPKQALVSGEQGLDAIHSIIQHARCFLKSSGYVMIEHGFQQGPQVRQLLSNFSYNKINSIRDFANQERVTWGLC